MRLAKGLNNKHAGLHTGLCSLRMVQTEDVRVYTLAYVVYEWFEQKAHGFAHWFMCFTNGLNKGGTGLHMGLCGLRMV